MSNQSHNHGNDHELVESSGIKAKPILIFLGALAAATALVFIIIQGLQFGFHKIDEMDQTQPATQLSTGPKLPPEPRLQGAPEPNPDKTGDTRASLLPLDDMAAYRQQINEKAASYEWVDKQGGVARIPIDRAKQLIAEKGLPALPDASVSEMQAAETVRKEVYNSDSSAGRMIKTVKAAAAPQPNATPSAQPVTGSPQGAQAPASQPQKPAAQPAAKARAATGGKQQ